MTNQTFGVMCGCVNHFWVQRYMPGFVDKLSFVGLRDIRLLR